MAARKDPPPADAYLTDGKRLAEVVGVDVEGRFHLADCAADIGSDNGTIVLTLEEVLTWEVVEHGG
jgi:hypothetical protein